MRVILATADVPVPDVEEAARFYTQFLGLEREDMGLDPDPLAAYARSGYAERIVAERVGGQAAGWGA